MFSPLLRTIPLFLVILLLPCNTPPASALTPDEVAVVANTRATDSVKLAKYYMQKRSIPKENLIKIQTTWEETCDRSEYETKIAAPIRKAVNKLRSSKRIRCLVTMYGIPLKIRPPTLDFEDKEDVENIKHQIREQQQTLKTTAKQKQSGLRDQIKSLQLQVEQLLQTNLRAAVDSELTLVLTQDYPLENWLLNPYFLGFQNNKTLLKRDNVLMVSRLDGPNTKIVRRIINDAIAIEDNGLKGKAYFDARWKKPETNKTLSGYALYDMAIHNAAAKLTVNRQMPVVLDDRNTLFQEGSCPDAALYCGWYSHAKYVDAFNWVPGAVGFHIASSECATLKQENSQVWCKRMLEEGVTATIGPVYEPYVQAFPFPDLFFTKLTEGYLTLGEVYFISLPYLSWQMVLIGDPLYLPFRPATEN